MLQPATKALAQMLAGRTGVSGQLNHARNLLAHAERLINDRVHNRLIPAEREEFFEQLARLRLTLADADAEAEVQAAEKQEVKAPPPPPIAQERLKEMALALSRPERDRPGQPRPVDEPDEREAKGAGVSRSAATAAGSDSPMRPDDASELEDRPPLRPLADLPGRLVLPRTAGDKGPGPIAKPLARRLLRPSAQVVGRAGDRGANEAPHGSGNQIDQDSRAEDTVAGNGSGSEAATEGRGKAVRRGRKTRDGLPEGWVIDEEGYVVPKHG
ncbi:MAG: hypothetical protein ACREIR_03760 [Geminicoccaceae bacterium]